MARNEETEAGIRAPEYRLPSDTRLGPVRLQVRDLERSLDFYGKILGLRVLSSDGTRTVLGPQEADVPLIELDERPGTRPVPPRGRLGLFHIALLLPDRPALGRFLRHLSETAGRPGMADHDVSEAVYLRDPDGLGIEVYADRPRSEWTHSDDGELDMGTEPLDATSVRAAAGKASWTGMPGGTTVGHIHLHVGDLDRAEAFYHEGLGFDKMVWTMPGALFLSAGGYHHHLGTNVWAGEAPSPEDRDAQLLEWSLVLPTGDEVDAATRHLHATGAEVVRDGSDAIVKDPWGTALRLTTQDDPLSAS